MSSRKPPGGSGGADEATIITASSLDDNANASVEIPASSEEPSAGEGEGAGAGELAISIKASTPTPPVEAAEESPATEGEAEKELEAKDIQAKTPTSSTSDAVAAKSLRVTRLSSPLLLPSSPTTSRREAGDAALDIGEEQTSSSAGQRKSSVERSMAPVIRGRKSIKDLKEAKEVKSEEAPPAEAAEELVGEGNESLESPPATDKKDHKDTKDKEEDKQKDVQDAGIKSAEKEKSVEKEKEADKDKEKDKEKPKEAVTPVTPVTPTCNRVTRKSHAQEQLVVNTRVTRNRRQSATAAASLAATSLAATVAEQLPPARGRRKKPVAPPVEPAVKRKRSQDADADPEATSSAKFSKVEQLVKLEEVEAPADEDPVTIKQEPLDASEVGLSLSPSVTPAPISGSRRGRGRPQNRNSSSPAATTRATRLSKAGSPGILAQAPEPAPPKRRRVGSSTRKTASASSLGGAAGDEDSKDSMASSMDDLLMAAADIKQEKLTPDFEDSQLLVAEGLPSTSGASNASANGHSCIEPLTVDTESVEKPAEPEAKPKESPAAAAVDESASAAAEKAPSLSPEMISEGVSAVSVRKFYKKPEFLENNLGIEKDPELGEIVQTVSSNDVESVTPQTEEHNEKEVDQKEEKEEEQPEKPEIVTEDVSEVLAEVPPEIPPEIPLEIPVEITREAAEEETCSNSSLKAGELRLEESTEEPELLLDDGLVVNGDEIALEQQQQQQQPPAEEEVRIFHSEEYDDFEHEIMEELAKEGVLDASGNALSQQQAESKEAPSPADEMVAMEVEESYVDIKQPTDQLEEEPEDNKENLSAVSTAAEALDIQIELKENVDDEEEKPLAELMEVSKEADGVDEKPPNGKQEEEEEEPENQLQSLRQEQEIHLQNLGLLTHQAAEQRRKILLEAQARQAQMQLQLQQHNQHKRQGARGGGGSGGGSATHVESSGTLKTVIKLNRSSNGGVGTVIHGGSGSSSASAASSTSSSSVGSATRKSSGVLSSAAVAGAGVRRQSLKMTFQKGRARGHGAADRSADQYGAHAEDSYYTIQNENEGARKLYVSSGNPGRKTNNRFSSTNNQQSSVASNLHGSNSALQYYSSHSESQGQTEHGFYQTVKKDEKEKILIPEKASSFKFHPGRLCEDQCYYCSGKFGLYDTPCHVGQIKSVERQQKILANEEKLTVDNCLCDACFRHVDRRANAPSYKKRLSAPGHLETGVGSSAAAAALEKHFDSVIPEASGETAAVSAGEASASGSAGPHHRSCAVKECLEAAGHSLRRKCIRKSVKKFQLSLEIPAGSSIVWLCEAHYNTVIQFSGCVLCKRRLGKNHMYNITTQDTDRLEKALAEMGIPVQLGMGTAVCKLCRYFANLLMKPPDSTKSQKAEFVKNYRKRLLKVHNLQDGSHEMSEADEEEAPKATAEGQEEEDAEMPLVVDYDGPTDSNSSSSSSTKQMSKLQAILQQNLGAEGATAGSGAAPPTGASGSSATGADISNVLRGNPNISMRELFHGEEELGVHFKVPFGCSSSQRTPEGWTRVQTFLQYDEPTRRLWEELQKPYGNQSSFLRHLILLEKYYRNGDLVLAPHASSNATVYTETVSQRLNSFDHGHCGGLGNPSAAPSSSSSSKRSGIPQPAGASVLATALTTPSSSSSSGCLSAEQQASVVDPVIPLVELNDDDDGEEGATAGKAVDGEESSVDKLTKQLSSNAVTIIARPKDKSQLSSNSGSSTSLSSSSSAISSPEEVAAAAAPAPQSKEAPPLVPAAGGNSRSILKTNLLGIGKAVEIVPLTPAAAASAPSASSAPVNVESMLTSIISKTSKSTACHIPEILEAANLASDFAKLQGLQAAIRLQSKLKPPMGAGTSAPQKPPNLAQLQSSPPELISLHRRRTSGAAAAPPANSLLGNPPGKRLQLARTGAGPSAGTGTGTSAAGGRAPPPNVVILPDTLTPQERHESKSWKPTLIPLEDQHKVPNKSHALYQTADGRRLPALVQVQSGGKPYLISIFDYNRMCILRREKLLRDQMLKANAKQKPQQQQQAAQGSGSGSGSHHSAASAAAFSNMVKLAQQHTARQQLQQLQQKQQHQQQQMPTLQPGGGGGGGAAGGAAGVRLARLAPKPMPPLTNPQIGSQAPSFQPLLPSPLDNSNSSWLWKNFPDPNQYLLNGNGGGGGGGGTSAASKLPHLTAKPATATSSSSGGGGGSKSAGSLFALKQQQHQQKLIENAIMSKIPKSLTVIPQQMGSNAGGEMGGGGSPPARTDDGGGGRGQEEQRWPPGGAAGSTRGDMDITNSTIPWLH
ncbi:LOW QUALITY PROTEIN: uncharacterized protein east [Drosophila takahashii]|uniref:LOW QUALITY PROTEIN: uncharacterized protein east n=1 Tax=Drosophila takahashii TaxID=29030 RepID=UPI003898DA7D